MKSQGSEDLCLLQIDVTRRSMYIYIYGTQNRLIVNSKRGGSGSNPGVFTKIYIQRKVLSVGFCLFPEDVFRGQLYNLGDPEMSMAKQMKLAAGSFIPVFGTPKQPFDLFLIRSLVVRRC